MTQKITKDQSAAKTHLSGIKLLIYSYSRGSKEYKLWYDERLWAYLLFYTIHIYNEENVNRRPKDLEQAFTKLEKQMKLWDSAVPLISYRVGSGE